MYTEGSVLATYLVRRINGGGHNNPAPNPLKDLDLNTTECIIDDNNDGICAPEEIISDIKTFAQKINKSISSITDALVTTQKKLGCDGSEACIYTKKEFKDHVDNSNTIIDSKYLTNVVKQYFKPRGPRNSLDWLDNIGIDNTLAIWARTDFNDFYPYSMNMMDFEGPRYYNKDEATMNPSQKAKYYKGSLATVNILDIMNGKVDVPQGPGFTSIKRPCKRMACVLNTDTSNGSGEHWVCIFIDLTSPLWTLEYFNSSGRPPPPPITRFLHHTKDILQGHIQQNGLSNTLEVIDHVATIQHQFSSSECGLYALFYIRKRLEGTPYTYFQDHHIKDEYMTEFRKYVFRN